MTAPDQAPETYQQWLACLCYMQNCPGDQHVHDLIMQGHFQGQVSETFKARLSETTGIMLTHFFRRFLRDMDRILADRELEMAGLLAVRFRKKS